MFVLGERKDGRTAAYCSSLVYVLLLLLFLLLLLVPEGYRSDGTKNWTSLRRICKSHGDELIGERRKLHGNKVFLYTPQISRVCLQPELKPE